MYDNGSQRRHFEHYTWRDIYVYHMWHGRDVLEYDGFFSSFSISLGEEKNTMYIMLIIYGFL